MLLLPTAVLATQTDVVKNTTTGATYPDLASAVNAASSGETLQLLSNVTLDSRLNINKSLTLDLADHTLTGRQQRQGLCHHCHRQWHQRYPYQRHMHRLLLKLLGD